MLGSQELAYKNGKGVGLGERREIWKNRVFGVQRGEKLRRYTWVLHVGFGNTDEAPGPAALAGRLEEPHGAAE